MKNKDEDVKEIIEDLEPIKSLESPIKREGIIENIKDEIIFELAKSIDILGGMSDILCIVGSYNDTQTHLEILTSLKDWNNAYSKFKNSEEFSPIYNRQ